ncbi:hypothetical protein ACFSFZ_10985 [Mixta tenebrionis]|uniref:Uncharacterized protein n=1 Tax=Mixta tenebrionis TaxID=2562439 RepID=A0A506VE54_9GAMM|nr:hypothetical protein [Mixta tenebrionis]TPW44321.1 hypothetical protein FKM52_00990 [Mixta tenebrionis]
MKRLMIATIIVIPGMVFANAIKFDKEMDFEGSTRNLAAAFELTTGNENVFSMKGRIDPADMASSCHIAGKLEHKKIENGKSDMYRFKDKDSCSVLIEVTPDINSPGEELISRVRVSEGCKVYCGTGNGVEVLNGFYKQNLDN